MTAASSQGSSNSACSLAIVGMACIYPEARTPVELWENVLAQRRAFRRLPPERLRAEDYWSADASAPDRTYAVQAAVIEGYEFDRVAFRVVGSTYRSADLAHWLALDVAGRALADAGFEHGHGLPRETSGVLLGNTLTGEFSRANVLRLRWPYVRRVTDAALAKQGMNTEERRQFLESLEAEYKAPFPAVGEETLAGGLSNTIAGRICNHFDLHGGGYTVDGACASSLLAVANACSSLAAGDLDLALAGGVDLSLDPFELVGFAKTGALASDEMRIFDRRSAGFWPGEGCGFVALMRHEDALAQARRIYAVIRGWGISSDGSGGLTRPEADGQLEALRRAYRRAGFGADTVTYCEAHGTGTAVGDATELEVLARARREAKPDGPPAIIGSIKANFGHSKAAAGIAGLIKATMAVHTQVLPPTTGCEHPHELLGGPRAALCVSRAPELWPADRPLRASVSAMGFGGINAHIVIESHVAERRTRLSPHELLLGRTTQDAELFLLAGENAEVVSQQVQKLLAVAGRVSLSELTDLAAELERNLKPVPLRAALVAGKPAELVARLQTLALWLRAGKPARFQTGDGVFLGAGETPPHIGFLFPGQGSPAHLDGGVWRRRFESVRELYARAELSAEADTVSTRVMQPAVVAASLAGLKVLQEFGLTAGGAVGHSLGELTALHWAGAFDEETLLRIAHVRGAAMAELGDPTGAMLAIAAPWGSVQELLRDEPLAIVGYNSPQQTVVAGESAAVDRLAQRAGDAGLRASRLPVSHAFHTVLVSAAVPVLAGQLARESFAKPQRAVASTITGAALAPDEDLRALLCRQVTSPVRFESALKVLLGDGTSAIDLLIEVGPGAVLSGLVRETTEIPVFALDAGGTSLKGLLETVGAVFALGAPVRTGALFADRFARPFALEHKPKFFVNPCELAPVMEVGEGSSDLQRSSESPSGLGVRQSSDAFDDPRRSKRQRTAAVQDAAASAAAQTPLELIRQLVAARAELPVTAIRDESRLLRDLHLNSITVGQLVSEAARQLGLPRVVGLTDFANASVAELAQALEDLKRNGGACYDTTRLTPAGVDSWVRSFVVEFMETKRPAPVKPTRENGACGWQIFAPERHPLAASLTKKFTNAGGRGVVVCLPVEPAEAQVALLLDGARSVASAKAPTTFVLVQHGWGGAGFARTLHLETPGLATVVINVPAVHRKSVEWILAEAAAANGYREAHYDEDGRRWEPKLKLNPSSFATNHTDAGFPLGAGDVLLVTGGGKGIAADCGLALARETGCRLALLCRSQPDTDKELAENLARFTAAGVKFCHLRADVTDGEAVRRAVAEAELKLGPVTALLHGAGTNQPQLIGALDAAAFRKTLAPKVDGARNVLAALNAARLKLFITFGSIIARAGLRGEADYATANEWLTVLTEKFQAAHPRCRCVALEWSVWSGVGMGERLGRIETLRQQGITPIPVDEGVRMFLELLRRPQPAVAMVVTGRFGEPPTLQLAPAELPLRRFLERTRVHYPGVELIVDAALSADSDPYLNDHELQKQKLFPAVLGLEAMAQAAMALTGSSVPPQFEQVELARPVVVPDKGPTIIRLAALRRAHDLVEVCLRSEETDFQVDHFRARCRFVRQNESDTSRLALAPVRPDCLPLDPVRDLYGRILFHKERFRRVRGYRLLKAKECVAELTLDGPVTWFGPYLPAEFSLGDPGARDAALHAIQACVPHRRILPTGIERLTILRGEAGLRFVRAKERLREGNNFIYDVEITLPGGEVIERWEGLHLRAVELLASREPWPEALLVPFIERRLEEIADRPPVSVALERGAVEERPAKTDEVIHQALGRMERIWRRSDGKPLLLDTAGVSAAHCRELTLAVAGEGGVACDLEEVAARTAGVWGDLLGREMLALAEHISRERNELLDAVATRLWSATECLKKIGQPAEAPLVFESATADGWVLLRSGALMIATCALAVRGADNALVLAVAFRSETAAQSAARAQARE